MNWIKLIITAVLFTVIVSLSILNSLGIIFIVGVPFLAGLAWSYLNKLNVFNGLKEGFLLGAIMALIYEVSYALYVGWVDFIWLIQIIFIFGIPSAVSGGLCGVVNSKDIV